MSSDGKKGNFLRNRQFWHKEMIYKNGTIGSDGQRWIVETVFSSIKRMFGDICLFN